ncbi:MAG: hypothetical protein PVF55_02420 [Desulfobacterales bacterium]|jgi:hypothetical protein
MRTDSGVGLMPSLFKSLFRKFHQLPDYVPARQYRFFVFSNYAFLMAGFFHMAFIFIFALLDLHLLSIYNLFSSLLWGFCIYLNFRGGQIAPMLAANAEVLIHGALCVAILGWGSGFHYYILTVPLVIFLSPWPLPSKIGLCTFNCIAYALLYFFSGLISPESAIPTRYVMAFNYVNMTSIFFSISFIAYYYRRVVLNVERNLEIAHGQTARALTRLNENLADAAVYVQSILPTPIDGNTMNLSTISAACIGRAMKISTDFWKRSRRAILPMFSRMILRCSKLPLPDNTDQVAICCPTEENQREPQGAHLKYSLFNSSDLAFSMNMRPLVSTPHRHKIS